MKYLLLLSLFLVSCGKDTRVRVLNDELYSYALEFVQEGKSQGREVIISNDLSIMFGATKSYEIGKCELGFYRKVVINENYWRSVDYWDRKELIYHELGHCVLNKYYHIDDLLDSGIPKSVMNSHHFDGQLFKDNYSYYIKELFRR